VNSAPSCSEKLYPSPIPNAGPGLYGNPGSGLNPPINGVTLIASARFSAKAMLVHKHKIRNTMTAVARNIQRSFIGTSSFFISDILPGRYVVLITMDKMNCLPLLIEIDQRFLDVGSKVVKFLISMLYHKLYIKSISDCRFLR
jgi:hypothetical protein